MLVDKLVQFIMVYKYFLLFSIAIFEGHIINLVAGFLIKIGTLNIFLTWVIILIGNITGDTIFYYLGSYHSDWAIRILDKYFKIKGDRFQKIEDYYVFFQNVWYRHNIINYSRYY